MPAPGVCGGWGVLSLFFPVFCAVCRGFSVWHVFGLRFARSLQPLASSCDRKSRVQQPKAGFPPLQRLSLLCLPGFWLRRTSPTLCQRTCQVAQANVRHLLCGSNTSCPPPSRSVQTIRNEVRSVAIPCVVLLDTVVGDLCRWCPLFSNFFRDRGVSCVSPVASVILRLILFQCLALLWGPQPVSTFEPGVRGLGVLRAEEKGLDSSRWTHWF